ncbi:DUF302 domain-containing protein [bacterium]|nr:DUF302 domain-containing protein [bacterium]
MRITTPLTFDEAIERVTRTLADQGFGILTEIDVKATLKKKLDVDYKPYTILGACNPTFAHKGLEHETHLGVLLPCNVVVWDEGDHRVIAAMDPAMIPHVIDNEAMKDVAADARTRIERALDAVEKEKL